MCGGRLGDNLVAIGAISKDTLERFVHRTPREPENIAATGLDEKSIAIISINARQLDRQKSPKLSLRGL